jgi:UDPglucose 6-dehydrogenase
VGADVDEVRRGIGSDSRIGKAFLFPGIGYGGSCFPKDLKALIKISQECGVPLKILGAVEDVNYHQKRQLFTRMSRFYKTDKFQGKHFALWGLAFKARTDDMREASALVLIEQLLSAGATVCAYDPEAMAEAKKIVGNRITYANDPMACLKGADALCIVTEWHEFRFPEFDTIRSLLKKPVIFDGRNLYKPAHMRALGFEYVSIGRGTR